MKAIKYLYFVLCAFVVVLMSSCEPRALTQADVFTPTDESELDRILKEENAAHGGQYRIYTLNEFTDAFMTEEGNLLSDTTLYRLRSTTNGKLYMFSVDTIKTDTIGIYIRGRVTTDDFGGNFYKSLVIQQIVNGEQQNLRISVDMGSVSGMYPLGQEILIRCNGLAIGRYANQPQLCVPSNNNNIYAMNASEKVGWAPGRIPSADFRKATRMIGTPDKTKLKYDTLTLTELFSQVPYKPSADSIGMDKVRKADGRLVTIKNVWFTGQYDNNGTIEDCAPTNPDSAGNANVFAPTSNNIGYPQSRIMADRKSAKSGHYLMCSNSEYAKFAYFYLPGANEKGIDDCENWAGTVTGILGWYQDKASNLSSLDGYEWAVTPRGIPGYGVVDIYMEKEIGMDEYEKWIPKEYNPKKQ